MFLKTGELKKIMKSSLKRHGLIVGNTDSHYLVYSDCWGVYVELDYASNKFKAAIMELVGDLPEPGECFEYTLDVDKEIQKQTYFGYPDPYEEWKAAKDFATAAPLYFSARPHEYMVYQKNSDKDFLTVDRALTQAAISPSELDTTTEHMPDRPSVLGGHILYYKNESTIYWVHSENPGRKALEVLFPRMGGIDFFEDDWKMRQDPNEAEEPEENEEAAGEERLPY